MVEWEEEVIKMEVGKCTLTYNFWLCWHFGFGQGWGMKWFDLGPFCIYWTDYLLDQNILYNYVSTFDGFLARYAIRLMLQGVSLEMAIETTYKDFKNTKKGLNP